MKPRIPYWQVGVFVLLLSSLACGLALPSVPGLAEKTAVPSPTPLPLPPTVVETLPPVGSVISQHPLLTVFFSEKMERASVESAIGGDFPGGFVFAWVDDATLTLAPKSALPAGKKVTFSLAAGARSAGGLAMPEALSLSYQTPGPLNVTQTLPAADAGAVSPDSAVVVAFNQPVVALGASASSLPAGLSLEPAVNGKGEWLNTSTYIFHADPALAGGVKYTARVNPALVSTDGMPLDTASGQTSWTFTTTLPDIISIIPDVKTGPINLDAVIEITFNQPMDRASVENAFKFNDASGKVDGSFEWNQKSSLLKFKPAALLKRATTYYLTIGSASHSLGGAALGRDIGVAYQSVPDFALLSTSFPNGQVRPANTVVALTFTAPPADYSPAELRDLVSISPKTADYYINAEGAVLSLGSNLQPGQRYTITFSGAMKDRWGQALGNDVVFTFTEPDANPSLGVGSFMSVFFTRPEESRIGLQAVNLQTLTVSRASMSLQDYISSQVNYNFLANYAPADARTLSLTPDMPRNSNQPVDVSLSDTPLPTGFYFISADSPEVTQKFNPLHFALVVSNLNVTLKISPTEALVWAVDLRSGQPAAKVPVQLYDPKGSAIASGVTDERGLWRGPIPGRKNEDYVSAVLANPGDDLFGVADSTWSQGIGPWDFGLSSSSSGPHPQVYLYSDRPVYRPGDTVHYRGILKTSFDGRYTPSDLKDATLTVFGPTGKVGQPLVITPSSYGTFDGDFELDPKSEPGYYNLSISASGTDVANGVLSFQVADYRKPEINLSASLSPDPALAGQPVVGSLKAEYFFGGAAADLPVNWSLYLNPTDFSIPQYETGIQTARWLSDAGQFGSLYKSGQGRTGPDGTFSLPLNDLKADQTSSLMLEFTTTESGGFPVSARASIILHPEKFYIGVRPGAWVGQAGTPLAFDLLSVDWDLHPLSQSMSAAFQKVRWERSDPDTYGNFVFTPIYTPVDSKTVTSGADGHASLSFTPQDAGTYVLDVTSGKAHTQVLVWVSGAENAAWPNLPYQQIQLTASRDKYNPGDTPEVFIPNPFGAPALALITTERSTIKSVDILTIPAAGATFLTQVTDDSAPNIYVSVTMLGPDGVDFRQGFVNLPVEPSAFTLNVDLKASPEKAKPGDTISLDLSVSDAKGQPVQAEFSMAVADLAALALADPNSVDIVPAFYSIQPLGVRTTLTAAVYTRRLINSAGGRGGGGGGEVISVRSKFKDTAYWKADIVTDAQGKAHITFTLPDNLTTWQVDTRGLTGDTRVGQARVRVVTSKELLVRPQTPRFLVVGDHAELAAMLNNTTTQALEATASLQVAGLTLDDPALADQKVSIPANGRVRVSWTGQVQNVETVEPVFSVKSGALQDSSTPDDGPIPVLKNLAPQTFSTAGILTGASSSQEIIAVPRTFQPLGGNLQVELSPSLAAVILDSLKALETSDQPWSSEQIISTLLPNLATYRALKDSGIDNPELTARLQNNLRLDMLHLVNYRRDDGGWAWTTSSQNSDPYLTAYVLFGMQQAFESGINLEGIDMAGMINSGRDYLIAAVGPLNSADSLDLAWKANRAAFYAYVLSQTGGLGSLNDLPGQLFDRRDRLDPWARAMLAQTIYKLSVSDERANTLLSDLESGAIRSATGAHWESAVGDWMNPATPLFTTAVVVGALAERNPASPLIADAVRYLASQRGPDRRWASTYETAWVLLALNKFMQASGELRGEFAFSAQLNGTDLAQGQASGPENMTTVSASAALSQLILSGANSLVINKQDGTGKLYYRASLSVDRAAETVPALDRGISVARQYLDCSSGTCQPTSSYQLKAGQSGRVKVKLTLTLPNDAYYLILQDYIPAGAAILDTSLKTNQQGEPDQSASQKFDPADPFGEGWGWWYFNRPQIYSTNILWNADYLPAGTYELTYTIVPSLAGEYRVLPAHAWQAYFPELQGATAGAVFEIKP